MEIQQSQESLDKLIVWLESSKDFVKEQCPDFIDQFLYSATIKTWMNIFTSASVVIILIFLGLYCLNKRQTYEKSYEIPEIISLGSYFTFPVIFIFLLMIYIDVNNLIDIYISPKVYIFTHLKDFLK